jgi:Protein of unknown function (DUF3489)
MSQSAKKQPTDVSLARKPTRPTASDPKPKKPDRTSKQSQVIAMLHSPTGATIAAMMKTTGWQQHSVRGFLAGVVHKRLKMKLESKLVDDKRVYRIAGGPSTSSGISQTKRAKA